MRPDAHPLPWEKMLRPTQLAVSDLLERLVTAKNVNCRDLPTKDSSENGLCKDPAMDFTSSFLLLGRRGSGKTTVLLSTKAAIEDPAEFFPKENSGECSKRELALRRSARERAKELGQFLIWLDLFDLGPLSPNANILVHILVRVRSLIELTSNRGEHKRASILEQDTESGWNLLERLIQKAAFLWGKQPFESDRKKSRQDQATEAEYYLAFRIDMQEAMKKAAETLTFLNSGRRERTGAILVSINNIDRRSEHFAELIRLIPLITGRHLWLVLAASQMDLEALLEKTIREEASTNSEELNDILRSLGRRHQAAARGKAFPPAQEVRMQEIRAEEGLRLRGPDSSEANPKLGDLLGRLAIQGSKIGSCGQEDSGSLSNLFDLTPYFLPESLAAIREVDCETAKNLGCGHASGEEDDEDRVIFSEAGRHALGLPHRNLVDLWMRLERISSKQNALASHECALGVAFDLLTAAVEASDLEPAASERLLSELIVADRHPVERGFLDFSNNPIRRRFLRQTIKDLPLPGSVTKSQLLLRIELTRFIGLSFELQFGDKKKPPVPLPPEVEGWLMILFDLVGLLPYTRVINNEPTQWDFNPRLVSSNWRGYIHGRQSELQFLWPIPAWETFLDYEVFIRHWQAFLKNLPAKDAEARQVRRLRAAYLDLIVAVSKARGHWNWDEHIHGELEANEKAVSGRISDLDSLLASGELGNFDRGRAISRWISEELPFYFCSDFGFDTGDAFDLRPERKEGKPHFRAWLDQAIENSSTFEGISGNVDGSAARAWMKGAIEQILPAKEQDDAAH